MKNIHMWPYTVSENEIWYSDACIGGVYIYDMIENTIHCEISQDVLFHHGIYRIAALAVWREYVFIFSNTVDNTHIFYNVFNHKVKSICGLENKEMTSIQQAFINQDILYLIPSEIRKCIYILDLNALDKDENNIYFSCLEICSNISTWMPKKYNNRLYIPECGGKSVFCLKGKEIEKIDLDIPLPMKTLAVSEEELWIVPIYGKSIYCVSLKGNVKEKIFIPIRSDEEKNNIWEIILVSSYVFLLHGRKSEIYIYDRKKGSCTIIDSSEFRMSDIERLDNAPDFLPYFLENNTIKFLPLKNKYLEIKLPEFSCERKEFGTANVIFDEKWDYWNEIFSIYGYGRCFCDKEEKSLNIFVDLIIDGLYLKENSSVSLCKEIGLRIYESVLFVQNSRKKEM